MNVSDPLCRALGLGESADAILRPLSELYADLDRELSRANGGRALPCVRGCDACCHESVFLSAPEFLAVAAQLLEERTARERGTLVDRMCALAEQFADELELLEELPPGFERDEVAARIRFRCPLLAEDGTCSVYRSRELNARTFGQTFDPERGEAYGCTLTHARLRVLGEDGRALPDARSYRRALQALLAEHAPGFSAAVRVYPWWFRSYGDWLR